MNETINNETLVTNDAKREKNGLATAALVLGILSLVTMLLLINYILGIVSLVLAIVYLKKKRQACKAQSNRRSGMCGCINSCKYLSMDWYNKLSF